MHGHQTIRHMWPHEARSNEFLEFLRKEYDAAQQAAIEVCTSSDSALPFPFHFRIVDTGQSVVNGCVAWNSSR